MFLLSPSFRIKLKLSTEARPFRSATIPTWSHPLPLSTCGFHMKAPEVPWVFHVFTLEWLYPSLWEEGLSKTAGSITAISPQWLKLFLELTSCPITSCELNSLENPSPFFLWPNFTYISKLGSLRGSLVSPISRSRKYVTIAPLQSFHIFYTAFNSLHPLAGRELLDGRGTRFPLLRALCLLESVMSLISGQVPSVPKGPNDVLPN